MSAHKVGLLSYVLKLDIFTLKHFVRKEDSCLRIVFLPFLLIEAGFQPTIEMKIILDIMSAEIRPIINTGYGT